MGSDYNLTSFLGQSSTWWTNSVIGYLSKQCIHKPNSMDLQHNTNSLIQKSRIIVTKFIIILMKTQCLSMGVAYQFENIKEISDSELIGNPCDKYKHSCSIEIRLFYII
jgi:hypothetical protein